MTHADRTTSDLYLQNNVCVSVTSRLTGRLLTHSVHRDTNTDLHSQPTHFVYCGQAGLKRLFQETSNCHLFSAIKISVWTLPIPAECTSDWGLINTVTCFYPQILFLNNNEMRSRPCSCWIRCQLTQVKYTSWFIAWHSDFRLVYLHLQSSCDSHWTRSW